MLDYTGLQQAIDNRGGRYCITGTIRPGEFDYRYSATSDEAEKIRDSFTADRRYQIRIHPPTADMDVAKELVALGTERGRLRDAEREVTAKLRAMVLRAADQGLAEADIARRADVDRMTIRKWLGK